MSQDPLLKQLAERCRKFSAGTGISLNRMAKLIGTEPTNFSAFINGRVGLSAKSTIKLMQLLNASKAQLEAKLSAKEIHLEHYQEEGRLMTLSSDGSGWVAREGDSAADPNNRGGDITTVSSINGAPSDDELTDVLRQVNNLHKQALDILNAYTSKIQKARPDPAGVTSGPRKIADNTTSRTPGPRGDLLSDPDKLREHLVFVKREREKAEETVKLQRQLEKERELMWAARVDVKRKELKAR